MLQSSIDPATAATDESDPNEVTALRSGRLETSAAKQKTLSIKAVPSTGVQQSISEHDIALQKNYLSHFHGYYPFPIPSAVNMKSI